MTHRLNLRQNKSFLLLVFFTLCAAFSSVNAATMTFDNGFESGNFSGYTLHLNGGTATTSSLAAAGKYSGKFELIRNLSKDTFRAEANLAGGKGDLAFNTEYWLSMTYRYEDWAKDYDSDGAPIQIHRRPSAWGGNCGGQVPAAKVAPFYIETQNDVMEIVTYGGVTNWSGPVVKNKWINVVFHFDIGWDSNGYVEAWKDGVKLFRRTGKLHDQYDLCGKPWGMPFAKIGIYKWNWKVGRPATQSSRRTLLIDKVRVAKGSDGLAMVSAAAGPIASASDLLAPAADLSAIRDDALIAHWPMNAGTGSTLADASGNGHTATLANGAQLSADGSVQFDGVNDQVHAGQPDISGKAMTLSGWVWADSFEQCPNQTCTIASKAIGPGVQDQDMLLGTVKKGSKTRLRFRLNADGATSTLTAKAGNVEEKSWVHVAAVFTGKRMRLYQDGALVGSKAHAGPITLRNNSPISIGGHAYDATRNPWLGKITDVRIYNYALSKKEIAELAK